MQVWSAAAHLPTGPGDSIYCFSRQGVWLQRSTYAVAPFLSMVNLQNARREREEHKTRNIETRITTWSIRGLRAGPSLIKQARKSKSWISLLQDRSSPNFVSTLHVFDIFLLLSRASYPYPWPWPDTSSTHNSHNFDPQKNGHGETENGIPWL